MSAKSPKISLQEARTSLKKANLAPGGLKLHQARAYLGGLSVPTMHRLIHRGLLKPNRVLRHLIFSREELDRFLKT